ncbi:uncharacterized protein CGFF_05262 [Nakaseomyces glabratus]|nr:uncharacterized protein CGFF_02679 [Nakaseomyces glabratus]SLM14173.1 uncharacterized protein CGFF_05262 [Nakaseomyces glabratus]
MSAIVQEYCCQYTDQVRKKHKTWHDGKLKFYTENNRFILYSDPDSTLLSSAFVTNSKELESILDQGSFGSAEHRIFGRYIVILEDLISEQHNDPSSAVHDISTKDKQSTNIRSIQSGDTKGKTSHMGIEASQLTLKFNKKYKRRTIMRQTGNSLLDSDLSKTCDKRNALSAASLENNSKNKDPLLCDNSEPNCTNSERKKGRPSSFKVQKRVGRIRKIEHKPINIPR